MKQYQERHYIEHLYFQTDKDRYMPGEPIWFTTFTANATELKRPGASKQLFVALLNTEGKTQVFK